MMHVSNETKVNTVVQLAAYSWMQILLWTVIVSEEPVDRFFLDTPLQPNCTTGAHSNSCLFIAVVFVSFYCKIHYIHISFAHWNSYVSGASVMKNLFASVLARIIRNARSLICCLIKIVSFLYIHFQLGYRSTWSHGAVMPYGECDLL